MMRSTKHRDPYISEWTKATLVVEGGVVLEVVAVDFVSVDSAIFIEFPYTCVAHPHRVRSSALLIALHALLFWCTFCWRGEGGPPLSSRCLPPTRYVKSLCEATISARHTCAMAL